MLLYEDKIEPSLRNLSRQKFKVKRNSAATFRRYKHKWNKWTNNDSNLRDVISLYIYEVNKKLKTKSIVTYYRSTRSEALYITYTIGDISRKLRVANHDSADNSKFDEEIKIHEFLNMKTLAKSILRFIDSCILRWRDRVTVDNFDSYFNKALSVVQKYKTTVEMRDNSIELKKEYENKLKETLETHRNYEDAINYLKEIIELLSRQHIEHLEKLLNSAVKTIFYDKNYEIKLEISEFRNSNSLNIYLIEYRDDEEIKTDIKSNGFGIQCIVGFILQVYFILYHKLSPVLFMDEALSNLSSQYIEPFKDLVNALVEQYGFIFVLVAHDPRFIDIADAKYEIKDGVVV